MVSHIVYILIFIALEPAKGTHVLYFMTSKVKQTGSAHVCIYIIIIVCKRIGYDHSVKKEKENNRVHAMELYNNDC